MNSYTSSQRDYFEEHAESLATRYDSHPALQSRRRVFVEEARLFLRTLDAGRELLCLDLGCGPGVIAIALAGLGLKVCGVDASPAMIAAARSLASRTALPTGSCAFVCQEITSFLDGHWERPMLVVSSSALEYMEDPARVVSTVAAQLLPQGAFVLSIPNRASLLRRLEPKIQRSLRQRQRYLHLWQNQMDQQGYLRLANSLGLSVHAVRYFGFPTLGRSFLEPLSRLELFGTMALLVFRKP